MSTPPANADGTIAEHRAERPDERDESDDDQHGEQGFNLDWIVAIVAIVAIAGTGWLLRFLYIAGSSPVRPTPGPTQTEPPAVYDPYGLGLFPW